MKFGKVTKRILALLLTVAIIGTGNGISTMAGSVKTDSETANTAEQKEETLSAGEIAEQIADGTYKGKKLKETKYYDTYEASDGSIIAAYYSSPVRYEDEDGNLQEYNPDLMKTDNKKAVSYTGNVMSGNYNTEDYAYVNTAGNSRQYFPEELTEDTPVLLQKEEYSLSMVPVIESGEEETSEESSAPEDGASEEKDEGTDKESQTASGNAVKSSDDTVEYEKENVTYRYVSMDNGVKENVIISGQPEEMTYSFSYTLDGMYMELQKQLKILN